MRGFRKLLVSAFFLVPLLIGSSWAQGSPEDALEELATAPRIEDVLKHLPASIGKELAAMTEAQKTAAISELLPSRQITKNGLKLTRREDGSGWELTGPRGEGGSIRLVKTFISGADAIVLLQPRERKKTAPAAENSGEEPRKQPEAATEPEPDPSNSREGMFFLMMRLDDGEWRLISAGGGEFRSFESTGFLNSLTRGDRGAESAAVSRMRTILTCLITYSSSYPEVGLPPSLKELSGAAGSAPSADHAMLMDPSLMEDKLVYAGYEFRYARLDREHFRMTAMPVEYGKTGTRSFFADDSGVIRTTTENRTPNENDEPLN